MTRTFKNQRRDTSDSTAFRRPPQPKQPDKPAAKKPKQKTSPSGVFTMTVKHRTDGFGLYVCKNCFYYKQQTYPTKEVPCKELGVKPMAMPCSLNGKLHGFFDPINEGKAGKVNIDHLDAGEAMVLARNARKHAVNKTREKVRDFNVGQKVEIALNGRKVRAEVVGLSRHYVTAETEDGSEFRLRPADVYKIEDGK